MANFNVPTQHDVTEQKVEKRHTTGFQTLAPALSSIYPTALGISSKGSFSVPKISVFQKKPDGSQGLTVSMFALYMKQLNRISDNDS